MFATFEIPGYFHATKQKKFHQLLRSLATGRSFTQCLQNRGKMAGNNYEWS
jgi:hypothetical protein